MVDAARDEDGKEEPDNSSGSVHDVHEESPMNETQLRRMMFVEAMTPGCSACARRCTCPGGFGHIRSEIFEAPLRVYEMTQPEGRGLG